MSHLSRNELESLVQEANEDACAGHGAVVAGGVAPASMPVTRAKGAFVGDVDMPQAVRKCYEKSAQWDHVVATFSAFIGDDLAAKKAGDY